MKNIILLSCTLLFFNALIFAQHYSVYPHGASTKIDSNFVEKLKIELRKVNTDWSKIKKDYFGDIYDAELPDLICYIDSNYIVRVGLTKDSSDNPELFGERYIWLIIFSDRDLNENTVCIKNPDIDTLNKNRDSLLGHKVCEKLLCPKSCRSKEEVKKDSPTINDSCTVNMDVLQYLEEPTEGTIQNILSILSKLTLGGNVEKSKETKLYEDVPKTSIAFKKFGGTVDQNSIYIGMKKFKLGLNTKNRIVIRPPEHSKFNSIQYIDYNFGNYEQSRFGVSIGAGYTFSKMLSDSNKTIDLYINGLIYLWRPNLPVESKSLSISLGTNFVTDKFLNNIIIGLRYGLWSSVGFTVGMNWIKELDDVKRVKLFLSLDYKL